MSTPWKLLVIYFENLSRVGNLIRLYEKQPTAKGAGRKPVDASDILRAAAVLQHAIFEEMCRAVEASLLPLCGEEELNDVPLVGLSRSGRPEKFFLGKLTAHRGKKIDELIKESISAHLAQSSYSTIEDFCAMLKRVGVDKKPFEPLFPQLKAMMERRHNIVHQCDKNLKRGTGHHPVRAISKKQISSWNACVTDVYTRLHSAIEEKGKRRETRSVTSG